MLNEIPSLWPVSRQACRTVLSGFPRARRVPGIVFTMAACFTLTSCGEEDDGVTYNDDVRPIFERRGCTVCHRPGNPIQINIQDPFDPATGLAVAPNTWAAPDAYPGETPEFNVVAGDPDNSFLMQKITGMLPANGHGGSAMPLQVPSLTDTQVDTLRGWVERGAPNDSTFET